MRASGSAWYAFPASDDEAPAVGVPPEAPVHRQLRLVAQGVVSSSAAPGPVVDPEASAEGAASGGGGRRTDGGRDAVVSLAAYVLGLGVGSPCFCCGEPLEAGGSQSGDGGGEQSGGGVLECRACGASLEGLREP